MKRQIVKFLYARYDRDAGMTGSCIAYIPQDPHINKKKWNDKNVMTKHKMN